MKELFAHMENVLLAVDTTEQSERAFHAALRMARSFDARLWLLDASRDTGNEPVQLSIDQLADAARGAGVDVDVVNRDGAPVDRIVEVSEDLGVDLIVAVDDRFQRRWWLGKSATRELVRRSNRPILTISRWAGVAPPDADGGFHHVLYPTDFSHESHQGLRLATMLTKHMTARLTLTRILTLPTFTPEAMTAATHRRWEQTCEDLLADELLSAMSTLDPTDVDWRIEVCGDPARGIADVASQVAADLIALPRHHRHGLTSHVLGHTSDNLSRIGPAPVLIFDPAPA
jgi:nucleotide-binding universal stress UspA family protein